MMRKIIAKILIATFLITNMLVFQTGNAVFAADNKESSKEADHKLEILVKYKNEENSETVKNRIKEKLNLKKLELVKKNSLFKIELLKIDDTDKQAELLEEFRNDPEVVYAQPNSAVNVSEVSSSDAMEAVNWGLLNNGQEVLGKTGRTGVDINAINAWNITQGSGDVVVGLLDSGIDYNHEQLAGHIDIENGWDFANDDNTVFDSGNEDSHGTGIAGVIAATAPNIKILPLKFIKGTTGYTSDLIDAIEYASTKGVKIINCSFGGNDNNLALKDAMQNSDILFICAAGNSGLSVSDAPVYPACFNLPNIISVSAIDQDGILASFSNFGSMIDVAAPGVNIFTTMPGNINEYQSGTSVAASFVTGIAALIKSYDAELSIADIKASIENNSVHCKTLEDKIKTAGRVDGFAALSGNVPIPDDYEASTDNNTTQNQQLDIDNNWTVFGQLSEVKEQLHYGQSGVNPASGNYSFTCNDMTMQSPGFQTNISRTYNSKSSKITSLGRGWTFGFEGSITGTSLVTVSLPNGSVQTFTYNSSTGLYSPNDSYSSLVKNGDNTYTLTTKDQYSYGFNTSGYLVWMKDRNANTITIQVDSYGKVSKVTDQTGRYFTVAYGANGYISTITDPSSRVVTYTYDASNRLIKVTDPMQKFMNYSYDSSGFLTTISDNENNTIESIQYSHTAGDNLDKVTQATDASGDICAYTYDLTNAKTTINENNNAKTWVYWYDASGYIVIIQDPEGKTEITEYYLVNGENKFGDIKYKTDRNGNTTRYAVDSMGNVTQITNPDGSVRQIWYDDKNNVIKEMDELGKYTYYVYDATKMNLIKKVQPLNGTDSYTDGVSDPNLFAITQYTYQDGTYAKKLLTSIIDPENNTTTYGYNNNGDQSTITDPSGNTTTSAYNNIGWKTSVTTPRGFVTSYTYDSNGLLEKIVQNGGETTRITYDAEGRKTQEVSPNQYLAANDGLPSAHVYNDSSVGTRYTYNIDGSISTVKDAENNLTSYTYDVYGNLLTETRPNGSICRYEYDIMNRIKNEYFKDNTSASEVLLKHYEYFILSDRRTQKTETRYLTTTGTAVTTYIYDYAQRLVEQQNPDGTKSRIQYNANGTVSTTTDTNGSITSQNYDGLNNLSEQWAPLEISNGSTYYKYTKITYDKAGKKKTEITGRDKVLLNALPSSSITLTYAYYSNGKLQSITDNDGRKTAYTYDADGNTAKIEVYTDLTNKNTTEYIYNYFNKPVEKKVHIRKGDLYGNTYTDNTDVILTTVYMYDYNGNLKTETGQDSVTTTYTYDKVNRQTKISEPGTDENGAMATIEKTTTYTWDGHPLTVTDANGKVTTYDYNQMGSAIKITDPKGGVTAYYYDLAQRKIAEVSPINYDSAKTLAQMNRSEYSYDLMDRLITKRNIYTDPVTSQLVTINTKSYSYDNNGNITKELDALGYDSGTGTTDSQKIDTGYGTEYTYNLAGKAVTMRDPVSKDRSLPFTIKYDYDALGRKTAETNAKGIVTAYSYNDAGNLLSITVDSQTVKTNTYDLSGRLITGTDGNGKTTTYTYNAFNMQSKVVYPGDTTIPVNTVTFQYDVNGSLKLAQDSLSKTDLYTYDNQGRQLSHTQQKSDGTQAITTSAKYDKNGNMRFSTDGKGTITENIFDELNRLTSSKITVSSVLKTTSYTYDANGNQLTQTDWRGNTYTNTYDPINRIIQKNDPYGVIQKLTYNRNSSQLTSTDALNNVTQYGYDKNNRLISTTDHEGNVTKQDYDDAGNVCTKTDGRGIATTFNYDASNRLSSVVNAKGETTGYTYDLNGNMLTQTDGNGNTTMFEYNAANKMTKKIDAGGRTGTPGNYTYISSKVESYTYYADGSMATKGDRNNKITSYTYDIHGWLLSQVNGSASISFTYDANGNQLTMTDSTGTTTRTYDQQNRTLTKTVPNIGTTTYTYDIISGVSTGQWAETTTDPKSNVTRKVYDSAGRLSTVTADSKTTTYNYYANGVRQNVIYDGGSREDYTYYSNNLLNTLVNKKANGTIIDSYSYTYDGANNQTSKTDGKGVTNYTYDSLNRLASVSEPSGKVTTYTFDKAGNRVKEAVTSGGVTIVTDYTYNEQNRLTKSVTQGNGETNTIQYWYDGNGNTTSKVNTVVKAKVGVNADANLTKTGTNDTGDITYYKYDCWNELIKVTTGSTTETYAYNGDGLRVKKTSNGTLTNYLYEGDKVILETDAANTQTARNVYGTNLLARKIGADTLYYMYNGHADVTALIGGGAELLENGSFDTSSDGWWLYTEDEAVAVGERETTEFYSEPAGYKISCTSTGTSHNHIQLYYYSGINISAGKTYRLTFRAKSIGGNTTAQIALMKLDSPWTVYAPSKEVTVGGIWNTYTAEFTANTSDNFARITFYLGGGRIPSGAALYIDSISFKEIGVSSDIVTASYYYDAFGNITEKSESGWINSPIKYAGYQFDDETGLYYLNARYYDSKIARFLTEDTYRGQVNDPLSLNIYTYCSNNPIKYKDTTGHWQQGDETLNQDARIAISRLTDLYYSTNDPIVKAQCASQANTIRNNPDNKAMIAQNSAVGKLFDAELKKDGSVSASDWKKISNTYNGSTTQNAINTINNAVNLPDENNVPEQITHKLAKISNTIGSISNGLGGKKPTQAVASNVSLVTNNNGSVTIFAGTVVVGTVQENVAYRYVSQAEYNVIMQNGYIPNTSADGSTKDVFVSPNKYTTVQQAEDALKIGTKYPLGNSDSPMYRVEFKMNSVTYKYAGNVEGSTGIEMTTTQKIYVDTDRIVPLTVIDGNSSNNKDKNSGSGGSEDDKTASEEYIYDDGGQLWRVDENGNWHSVQQSPFIGPFFFPINPSLPTLPGFGPVFEPIPVPVW